MDEEAQAAAQEAARIGGEVPSEMGLDPAQRPLVESGEGVAEDVEADRDIAHAGRREGRGARGRCGAAGGGGCEHVVGAVQDHDTCESLSEKSRAAAGPIAVLSAAGGRD